MRTNYYIKSSNGSEEHIYTMSSTKREIESKFNRLMKMFTKDPLYCVEIVNLGYSRVTYIGGYGMTETEYWITKA